MLSRFFQESDHLLALYTREPFKEMLNRIASLQMIEQTLHRHPSTSENRLAAKNLRVLRYDAAHDYQNTVSSRSSQNRCLSAVVGEACRLQKLQPRRCASSIMRSFE